MIPLCLRRTESATNGEIHGFTGPGGFYQVGLFMAHTFQYGMAQKLWDGDPGDFARPAKTEKLTVLKYEHYLQEQGRGWRCINCRKCAFKDDTLAQLEARPCTWWDERLALGQDSKGHLLMRADSGLLWCAACGNIANQRMSRLGQECPRRFRRH